MKKRIFAAAFRVLLVVLGVAAIMALVSQAGTDVVLGALGAAGAWFPVLVVVEIAVAALDVFAVRALYADRGRLVPRTVWLRSALIAVASAHFLPGGRVLGEVARASSVAPYVGAPRAAAVAILTHGTYLVSISLASIACLVFVATLDAERALLQGLLVWTVGFTAVVAALFLVGPRIAKVGAWLGRRIGILESHGPALDAALRDGPLISARGLTLFLATRALHVLSTGALFVAVGVDWDTRGAFVGTGVQLVAANIGDAVPGQTGVLEGAYRLFAPSLGLADAAALAVAMALVIRAARLGLATVCAGVAAVWRAPGAPSKGVAATTVALGFGLVAFVGSVGPAHADAQEAGTRLVVHQRAVGIVNPMGMEHMVALGLRAPIGDPSSPLMAGAHVDVGLVEYTSPIYSMTGVYLQWSPVAFLVLRAEMTGVALWSIGMDGAGFYPVDGYGADVQATSLPAEHGDVAAGVNVQAGAILQGAVQLGPFRPILWSQLVVEHERLGEQEYRYSPRYDLVLHRDDWMIASTSMALVEVALARRVGLRLGAYDDLRVVPASGHVAHQLGPTVMVAFDRLCPSVHELLLFARVAPYLEPERRQGQWTGLVGLMARYDLGAL